MLDKQTCVLINSTSNMLYTVLDNKLTHWKFLHYIMPRNKFKKINYIKKEKLEDTNRKIITQLARRLELSTKEINVYIEQTKLDLSKYEHQTKSKH